MLRKGAILAHSSSLLEINTCLQISQCYLQHNKYKCYSCYYVGIFTKREIYNIIAGINATAAILSFLSPFSFKALGPSQNHSKVLGHSQSNFDDVMEQHKTLQYIQALLMAIPLSSPGLCSQEEVFIYIYIAVLCFSQPFFHMLPQALNLAFSHSVYKGEI